jgi:hypothetical protein
MTSSQITRPAIVDQIFEGVHPSHSALDENLGEKLRQNIQAMRARHPKALDAAMLDVYQEFLKRKHRGFFRDYQEGVGSELGIAAYAIREMFAGATLSVRIDYVLDVLGRAEGLRIPEIANNLKPMIEAAPEIQREALLELIGVNARVRLHSSDRAQELLAHFENFRNAEVAQATTTGKA